MGTYLVSSIALRKKKESEDKIVSSIEYIVYSEEKEERTGIKI